eukprot:2009470-Prymnesium_polylepis.1
MVVHDGACLVANPHCRDVVVPAHPVDSCADGERGDATAHAKDGHVRGRLGREDWGEVDVR